MKCVELFYKKEVINNSFISSLTLHSDPLQVTAHLAPDMDLEKFHQILKDKFSLGGG